MSEENRDDPIFGDKPDDELSGLGRPSQPEPAEAAQPGPPAPPAVPPAPATGGTSSALISDAFSWAVARFQQHAAILVALAAAVFALRAAQTVVGNAVVGGETSVAGSAARLGLTLALGVGFGIAAWLASIGVYRAALRRTQGVTPSFDALTTGENLLSYVLVAIALGVVVSVGLLLCILPGLVAVFLFMFAPFLALDEGMGIVASFRTSYQMVMANIGTVLVAALVNIVATLLGGILFGLFALVMLPFSALFTAYVYRSLRGEPVAP